MLRDNLVELIEPMLNSAGADPLALYIHTRTPASDDRLPCLKNPRPEGAESSLTESASSPFQAEPAQTEDTLRSMHQEESVIMSLQANEILELLKEPDRLLLRMVVEGYDLNEISEKLGLSYGDAAVRLHRIRNHLRNYLEAKHLQ